MSRAQKKEDRGQGRQNIGDHIEPVFVLRGGGGILTKKMKILPKGFMITH
jgi:hypothetical protein